MRAVLHQFFMFVGGRKFHTRVRYAVLVGSMHSDWMTLASSGHGKFFVAVPGINRMLHVHSLTYFCRIFDFYLGVPQLLM